MQKLSGAVLGNRMPHRDDIWHVGRARALGPKMHMVTFMEVKGHQRSNGVNYMCYGYHIWSKEALMQAENNDDLDGGQRSSEVKWGKLCAMATIFGQKKP